MVKLQQHVAKQHEVVPVQQEGSKPMIFGFTPLIAGMMSLVVLAIVFVGYELLPNRSSNPIAVPPQITKNNVMPVSVTPTSTIPVNSDSAIAEVQEDSSKIEKDLQQISPELEEKINYVKTQ